MFVKTFTRFFTQLTFPKGRKQRKIKKQGLFEYLKIKVVTRVMEKVFQNLE